MTRKTVYAICGALCVAFFSRFAGVEVSHVRFNKNVLIAALMVMGLFVLPKLIRAMFGKIKLNVKEKRKRQGYRPR